MNDDAIFIIFKPIIIDGFEILEQSESFSILRKL